MDTKELLHTYKHHTKEVYSGRYSRDGKHIVTTGLDRLVVAANVETGKAITYIELTTPNVYDAVFSSDGMSIFTVGGVLARWSSETGNQQKSAWVHTNEINHVHLSADGKHLVTASSDKTVRLWNAESLEVLTVFPHPDAVITAFFSKDSSRIISACVDQIVRIWSVRTGRLIEQFETGTSRVKWATYSPHAELIATTHEDGITKVWQRDR